MAKAKKKKANSKPTKKTKKETAKETKKVKKAKSSNKGSQKKTKSKAAATKAPQKKVEVEQVEEKATKKDVEMKAEKSEKASPSFLQSKYAPFVVAALIILAGLAYLFKDMLVVAWVNGQPVSRLEYVNQMEQQIGEQTLDNMVLTTLIEQEAQKQGVMVTDEEIQNELTTIEQQVGGGQEGGLDQLLAMQGMTRADLVDQIRTQKLVEKLAPDQAEVSEEEVQSFIEENEQFLPEDATEEELQQLAREQLASQSQQQQIQAWLDGLKAQADIVYWE